MFKVGSRVRFTNLGVEHDNDRFLPYFGMTGTVDMLSHNKNDKMIRVVMDKYVKNFTHNDGIESEPDHFRIFHIEELSLDKEGNVEKILSKIDRGS